MKQLQDNTPPPPLMTAQLANCSTVQGVGTNGTNNTAPVVQKAARDLGRLLLQSSQTGWHPRRGFFILRTAAARLRRHTQPGTRGLEGSSHRPPAEGCQHPAASTTGTAHSPPAPPGTAHAVPAGCGLQPRAGPARSRGGPICRGEGGLGAEYRERAGGERGVMQHGAVRKLSHLSQKVTPNHV